MTPVVEGGTRAVVVATTDSVAGDVVNGVVADVVVTGVIADVAVVVVAAAGVVVGGGGGITGDGVVLSVTVFVGVDGKFFFKKALISLSTNLLV